MKKTKLLRMAMVMALLAPSMGNVRVFAQDSLLDVNHTKSLSEDDSSIEESDQAEVMDDVDTGLETEDATSPESPSSSSPSDTSKEADDKKQGSDTSQTELPSDQTKPEAPEVKSPLEPSPQPSPEKATPQASAPLVPFMPSVSDEPLEMPNIPSVNTYAAYVDHWSGKDAYTHNLLSRRYGIKAEQLDGFLKSTGIQYDSKRINGAKLLKWEKMSGLDVRAIIAISMTESSLGTQGVARLLGANMFGYAAFDLNPNQASQYNDDIAIVRMTQETIIKNKNTDFALQDHKASKFAKGLLNFASDGGLYFTDTSGSGKRRAQIMEAVDTWIDQHGGTPAIPAELKIQSSSSFENVPVGYQISKSYDVLSYQATSYAWGQCTWYVYNRAKELGYQFDAFMGNGGDWKYKAGFRLSKTPKVGYAISFAPGQAGADATYGHVSIVEEVRKDGSILISESNCIGLGKVSYRTFTPQQAEQLTYVVGKK
ncbi:CHAP domain-containing protein [Streptococcus ictaluri]|uniref:CHAP domain protein n=1 Tax=Streptococcus ictaluri 707-05 TaxID=764299 RepID=G5JZY3_9STRE|nr:CHAP domain-containing protein [Streptococcus ictaluri]EHI70713.1 CHAP domain protein [Streptococcus ictaluri 707-05]